MPRRKPFRVPVGSPSNLWWVQLFFSVFAVVWRYCLSLSWSETEPNNGEGGELAKHHQWDFFSPSADGLLHSSHPFPRKWFKNCTGLFPLFPVDQEWSRANTSSFGSQSEFSLVQGKEWFIKTIRCSLLPPTPCRMFFIFTPSLLNHTQQLPQINNFCF